MTPTTDEFAAALDRCMSEFGLDLIADRERVVAIVADLVGESGGTSARRIIGLRAALEHLAGPRRTSASSLRAAIVDTGVPESEAEWLASIVSNRVDRPNRTDARMRRRVGLSAGGVAVVVIGVIAFLVIRDEPATVSTIGDETPSPSLPSVGPTEPVPSPSQVSTSTTPDQAPTPTASPSAPVLTAEFEAVNEGPFTVERTWTVDGEVAEIRGSIVLTNRTSSAIQANHRELPPPAAVADESGLQWSPAPAISVRTTGVFNVRLDPGEQTAIGFVAPIDASVPVTDELILAWFESWAPAQAELNSVLDAEQPPLRAPTIVGS